VPGFFFSACLPCTRICALDLPSGPPGVPDGQRME